MAYHEAMSTQIAVRLPDPLVAFLDEEVATGRVSSRAALVASALEREMRRLLAERDVEILQREGAADELDGLVDWAVDRGDAGA
jgi:Arc/MetJ-type ribon-helix-helix transcriptional regulator